MKQAEPQPCTGLSHEDTTPRPDGAHNHRQTDEMRTSSFWIEENHHSDFPNLIDGKEILGDFLKEQITRPFSEDSKYGVKSRNFYIQLCMHSC